MSAFFVGRAHCDLLAYAAGLAARDGGSGVYLGPELAADDDKALPPGAAAVPGLLDWWRFGRRGAVRLDVIGWESMAWAVLMLENVRSLRARYADGFPDAYGDEIEPDTLQFRPGVAYRIPSRMMHPSPAHLLQAVVCYRYQACESAEWAGSAARAIVEHVERWAVRCVIEQGGEIPWGHDWQHVHGDDDPAAPPRVVSLVGIMADAGRARAASKPASKPARKPSGKPAAPADPADNVGGLSARGPGGLQVW